MNCIFYLYALIPNSNGEVDVYVSRLTCVICSPFVKSQQKVKQKNQEMKVLMDQMRNLLWDINAMLTMRK